jgi:hypothetical protein
MNNFDPEKITLPPDLSGREWLTYEEFGALAGVKGFTVRAWERRGLVKVKRFTPRCNRIPISEIERLKNGELMG